MQFGQRDVVLFNYAPDTIPGHVGERIDEVITFVNGLLLFVDVANPIQLQSQANPLVF